MTPALEKHGVPTVMLITDTFASYARRMAAAQGCPYVAIAETAHPIRQLDADSMRARAEAMMPAVIDGLTLPPAEIERRLKNKSSRSSTAVRSGNPI